MSIMKVTKILIPRQFRVYLKRYINTPNKIDNVLENKSENTSFNKNMLLYNYIKKANSNKHLISLPDALNYWLKIPQDKLQQVKKTSDILLQAIILLDDVQDGTKFRRNLPSAHRIYGVPWAVNSSLFCIILGLKNIVGFQNLVDLDEFFNELMSALDGIALDVYWRDAVVCPTEDQYKTMAKKKTATFYLLLCRLMQAFSQNQENYQTLLITLGLYYQIRDDYVNLGKLEALDTKTQEADFRNLRNLMFCEDITEGKFTWPMIHGLNSREAPTIRRILVQRTDDVRIKQHCLSLLEKVGSLEYTRQTLQQLDADLRDQIHQLGGNPVFISYLDELYNWK